MTPLEKELCESLRHRNKHLIDANRQLIMLTQRLSDQQKESERYVEYLERVLNEIGWNPNNQTSPVPGHRQFIIDMTINETLDELKVVLTDKRAVTSNEWVIKITDDIRTVGSPLVELCKAMIKSVAESR